MPGRSGRCHDYLGIASASTVLVALDGDRRQRPIGWQRHHEKICDCDEMPEPLLRKVDAVTFNVPDLDTGLHFYVDSLGHQLRWRNDDIGQAALSVPDSDTEIVLTTQHGYEPNWLVQSADEAASQIAQAGGTVLAPPFDIPVGRVAVAINHSRAVSDVPR